MNKKFFIITGLLFCGTLLIPVLTEAQSNLTNTPTQSTKQTSTVVTFEDANLEAAIRETLNIPIDEITSTDMQRLTSLNINNKNISSLKGLEYANNLTSLTLNNNQISNLSPIQHLTKLTHLSLYSNKIQTISPLAQLTDLVSLNLGYNQISNIQPLSKLTKLTSLNLFDNRISDIAILSEMTSLVTLSIGHNSISDMTPISNLTALTSLTLQGNTYTNLNFLSNLTNLVSLNAGHNTRITDISPIKNLEKLDNLHIGHNSISDLSPLSGLKKLTTLSAHANKISNLTPLSNLTSLKTLNLHWNKLISDLSPLSVLKNLSNLTLYDNNISNLNPLSSLTNLWNLEIQNNYIDDLAPLTTLTKLSNLNLGSNNISDLTPLQSLTNLNNLYLSKNKLTTLTPLNNLTNLKKLNVDYNQIADFSILPSSINSLSAQKQTIIIENLLGVNQIRNPLKNIDGSPISIDSTETITEDGSFIILNKTFTSNDKAQTTFSQNNIDGIIFLNHSNSLNDIDPTLETALKKTLKQEEITVVDLTQLSGTLNLNGLNISNIQPLEYLTDINNLQISNNQLTDIDVLSNLTNLTTLNISYNQISNVDAIQNLVNLQHLQLNHNQIKDIQFVENLSKIENLYLNNNLIKNIDSIRNSNTLKVLNLGNNKISDLTPLKTLSNLTTLYIGGNQILDFSSLSKLESLTTTHYPLQSSIHSLPYKNNRATNPFRHPDGSYAEITNLPKGVTQSKDLSTLNFETITEGDTYSFRVSFGSAKITLENPVSFKDQKFKQAVLKSLGEKERVFPSQLTQLTELDLSNAQIESLEDLRHFPNLTTLNIENNAILDFSPLETYGANLTQVSIGEQCGELKVIATDGMTFENPLKNLDKTFVEIYNDDSRVSIADDFSTFTVTYDVIKERQSTFRFNGKNGFNGTATFILNGKVSQLPEDIAINGIIEPTILSIRVPSEINYTINPNLTPSVVVPSFELTNETVTPLTVEVETISSSMGGLSLTPLTTYTDEEWSTLPKNQAHQIGLGLTTTTQIIDLSQNTKQSLGLLSNTQPLELALVVKHSQSISESNQLSLILRFTFGLLD